MENTCPSSVDLLTEAMFGLDGGAMFGIIPKPLWNRTNPGDENNRINLACRCMLVRYPGDVNVLVDVGIGTKWSDKEREIYKINRQDAAMEKALAASDLTPEDIDHVVLTHLHFDHAGGVSTFDDANNVVPTFPNAQHWVQKRNWGWANSPSARDGGSYRQIDFGFFEGGEGALELVDGPGEILPGIEVFPMNGHTFGMQIVKVTDAAGDVWVHLADLIPTTSHLRDPYVMGYDLQPLVTVEEKREILYHAARNDWWLVFEHDPEVGAAQVEFDERERPRLRR
jgi:glyoxylase-like metal-dependent hydrolase (beta-lactamase superfamily II)